MKIGIIIGNQRQSSESAKIGRYISESLLAQAAISTVLIDLAAEPLPLWDIDINAEQQGRVKRYSQYLKDCQAFVVISPEWHGMVPAALKNFFLFYSGGELAHKPALIVSVSAGDGGAYPVTELRSSSYKNSRICYLPEHVIIRNVGQVFNDNGDNNQRSQQYLNGRLVYALDLLLSYGKAMIAMRQELPDGSAFPNGM